MQENLGGNAFFLEGDSRPWGLHAARHPSHLYGKILDKSGERVMEVSVAEGGQELAVAGFWRRIGAIFFDTIILGVFGMLIGGLMSPSLSHIGAPARLIGFVVALAYFGILNSRI